MLVLQSEKNFFFKKVNEGTTFAHSFIQWAVLTETCCVASIMAGSGLKGNLIWVPLWKGYQSKEGDCEPLAVGEGGIQTESIPVLWSCNILSDSHMSWQRLRWGVQIKPLR